MSDEAKRAIVIDSKMIKKILAEKNVIKSQYSWTVVLDVEDDEGQ